jgi:nucleoside phosphorylase
VDRSVRPVETVRRQRRAENEQYGRRSTAPATSCSAGRDRPGRQRSRSTSSFVCRPVEVLERYDCGRSVVLSRTDEGPLNAAAASALGMHLFRPRAVVNFGIAGAHNPELRQGDLVIARDAVDYSGFRSLPASRGEGIDCGRWTPKPHKIRTSAETVTGFSRFSSDPALVELARTIPYDAGAS